MFILHTHTSNNAMQFPESIAEQLEGVANRLRDGHSNGSCIDANGNKTGSWQDMGDRELAFLLVHTPSDYSSARRTTSKELMKRQGGAELHAWLTMCSQTGGPGEVYESGDYVVVFLGLPY